MIIQIIEDLLRNALLLFALVFVYGALNVKPNQKDVRQSIVLGLMIGFFVILVMLNPWVMEQGLIFDTRSVLMSITAAFFSPLTTVIAASIGVIYRIILGGQGVYSGVGSIVVSVAVGFVWHFTQFKQVNQSASKKSHLRLFGDFLIIGFVANFFVLLCQIFLIFPYWTGWTVVVGISLPFLVIYPIVTGILAISLINQIDRMNAHNELSKTYTMLQAMIESPKTMAIYSVDKEYKLLACNTFFKKYIRKWTIKDVGLGDDISTIYIAKSDCERWKEDVDLALTGRIIDVIHENAADDRFWRFYFAPIFGAYNEILGVTGFFSDVTEEVTSAEKNKYLSYHDYLTGLFNRRYYNETLEKLEADPSQAVSIVEGDINGLKLINDAFGHGAGDKLLIEVSNTLSRHFAGIEGVIRMGGDEFLIFLLDIDHAKAVEMVEAIKTEFEKTILYGMPVSVSFGVATRKKDEKMTDVVKRAEVEMYNKKLFELLSQRAEAIKSILNTLYVKNPREQIHSHRVSELCQKIGSMYHLQKDELNMLKIIGDLHDIGKIAIDESILNKPGKLTATEWDAMRHHPEIGYRILASSGEYAEIADDILAHHEHWDGSGYPKGLVGEAIPWHSRIIAIADSFDAMTAPRTYRESFSQEEALDEIERCAGTQFDPEIARRFVEEMRKEKS